MTDIVEWLNAEAERWTDFSHLVAMRPARAERAQMLQEAAAELTRLRAEKASYAAAHVRAVEMATEQIKEVDRLRARVKALEEGLDSAIKIAGEAREQWDLAPEGMRAGKILVALSGNCPGYRADIDKIHALLDPARSLLAGETAGETAPDTPIDVSWLDEHFAPPQSE